MSSHMYISFKGISGDSAFTKAKPKAPSGMGTPIEILNWNHSFVQPTSPTRVSAGAGTVERASHANLSFSKYMDTATSSLLKFCWNGKQIDAAVLSCYRSDGTNADALKYLEITMNYVVVASVSVGGGSGDIPIENVSLSYGKVKYNYIPQKKDKGTGTGNSSASHDLTTNTIA